MTARRAARHALEEERRTLQSRLRNLGVETDAASLSSEYLDMAHSTEQQDATARDHHRLVSRLVEVERALERMSQGDYGICVACAGPIPATRLRAVPAATRCRPCQEATEPPSHR